jgi:hypothetical protein
MTVGIDCSPVQVEEFAILSIGVGKIRIPKTPTPLIVLAEVGAEGKSRRCFEEEVAHVKIRSGNVE